jgi:hypothetical protein
VVQAGTQMIRKRQTMIDRVGADAADPAVALENLFSIKILERHELFACTSASRVNPASMGLGLVYPLVFGKTG